MLHENKTHFEKMHTRLFTYHLIPINTLNRTRPTAFFKFKKWSDFTNSWKGNVFRIKIQTRIDFAISPHFHPRKGLKMSPILHLDYL
jgi:hypothetical protein